MKLYHLYEFPLGGIILVVLTIIFTLCVGPANAASEPGTVTIVVESEPVNLDPGYTTLSIVNRIATKNIMETLTEMNPADSSIMPKLAHSWKQIDAHTWHFFLQKGVKFHDGADFNAEAVIFNIKRLYDTRIESRLRSTHFTNLKMEGKALDSHTLAIKTDRFDPLLPILMNLVPICSPNTPLDSKLIRNPIGTGPYRFVKWDAGTQIILERFDGYWGKQSPVKRAVYVWRTESSVRAAMVLIGEADLAPSIAPQDAKRPDMDYSFLNGETTHLRFSGECEPPLNDRRVRMSLNYAVDRDAIRGSILSKDVIPASQLVVPNIFGHNPDVKPWPYDPQKARQLVDEARKDGVPVDKEILIVVRMGFFPGAEELGEAMQTMYRAAGLNVKLKIVETGVWTRYRMKPFPPNAGPYCFLNQHGNIKGDAIFSIFHQYHCKGNANSLCDKSVTDLIDKAQVAMGEERRNLLRAVFKRANEEIIHDVILFHMVGYARVGKRINFKPSIATSEAIPLTEITFRQ